MSFFFDTNSFSVLRNYYPERFPSFWHHFEEAVEDEVILSVREVLNELRALTKGTWLVKWADEHKAIFRAPSPAETQFIGEIFKVRHFQAIVGKRQQLQGKPVADPFVIAAAKINGGCVVTEEILKPNAVTIPNVCDHFSIDCTDLQGLLERLKWSF